MGASADPRFMAAALALAGRGLGSVWPNPAVGCVIVQDGSTVVGRGWTQPGGRPHAETEALKRAGAAARGATAYVSLEPCSHHGKTPPCAEALIAAGIRCCVVACQDPDPRVSGAGLARLRAAGIETELGMMAAEALALNRGFLLRVERNRPLVTLKLATSLDGRIATHAGHSQWITGDTARAWGHGLRARHDAILVGSGTARTDDPELTCRLPGLEGRSPVRVVADSRLSLSLTSKLARGARRVPLWIACRSDADHARLRAFADCGAEMLTLDPGASGNRDPGASGNRDPGASGNRDPGASGNRDPGASGGRRDQGASGTIGAEPLLAALAARGITRVLVEGGSRLAGSLLRAGLVDRLEWFRAPLLIGGDGLAAVSAFGVDSLDLAAGFECVGVRRAGNDLWESFVRRNE